MKRAIYDFITTRQRGFLPSLFRILLTPFCWLYCAIILGRNYCYTLGLFKQKQLSCIVISVGNIVVGGTGKTPATDAIAKLLYSKGHRVALVLSGYKRCSNDAVTIVSDGENQLCSSEESGDEADMLARQLSDIPIVVGKQRYLAGKAALERFDSEVLILDDGFQHRQLARDLDIVTIDATQPYGTSALLPIGMLREPISALQRADIILLTRTDADNINITELKTELTRLAPNTPILQSVHQPTSLYWLNQNEKREVLPLTTLMRKRLLAVCGIGNPDGFVTTLKQYDPTSIELFAFPDHHVYTETDVHEIQKRMQSCNAELVITTQKDEQKLISFSTELPIVVLAVELVITDGDAVLLDAIQKVQK